MGLVRIGAPPYSKVDTGFGIPSDVRLIDVMLVGPAKTKKTKENNQVQYLRMFSIR